MAEKTPEGLEAQDGRAGPVPLIPEGDVGPRRFVVVITEVGERIVHKQQWVRWVDPAGGPSFGGFHTTPHREVVEKEIFRGEFTERPKISALATLMETPAGAE
ncbi:hypothetical protein [Gemmatimonas sp.]